MATKPTTTAAPGSPNAQQWSQQVGAAAGQLITVTGDKTIEGSWSLGDAIADARDPGSRRVTTAVAKQIRAKAIADAGHDTFWSAGHLAKMGNTAIAWPKDMRLPGVAIGTHAEAYALCRGALHKAHAELEDIAARQNGKVSTRDVRDHFGANGGTKGRAMSLSLSQASESEIVSELWVRHNAGTLKKYLRGKVGDPASARMIVGLHTLFTELNDVIEKLNAKANQPQSQSSAPTAKPASATAPKPKKRERISL